MERRSSFRNVFLICCLLPTNRGTRLRARGNRALIRVEVLFLAGCPNFREALATARSAVSEVHPDAEVALVEVDEPETAERLGFLGSPTVRVNGRDVEPGAAERRGYALACRVYETPSGPVGVPPEGWITDALRRDA
jgi:hypothetical protein